MNGSEPSTVPPEDFRLGADVFTSDGKRIGVLFETLVDVDDYSLQAVVVKESKIFTGHLLAPGAALMEDEVAIPVHHLKSVGRDRVDLALTSLQVRRLPPYLSFERRPPTAWQQGSLLLTALGGNPVVIPLIEKSDKPESEIEIDPGEPVMLGHLGRRIGRVKEVLFEDYELIGVVIQPEGWFRHPVILPRRFLERSDDAALFVVLNEDELASLKPFMPASAANS